MLHSIPSKISRRIILDRMQDTLDKRLQKEQADFRKDYFYMTTLIHRIFVEQFIEWQTPLHINFVDFEKAFDSLDRNSLWKLLWHYGVPQKYVNLIRSMYEVLTGQVTSNRIFHIKTGVRQGCLSCPFAFLIAIDWTMTRTTAHQRTGSQWSAFTQLEDLGLADDLALVSESHRQTQQKNRSTTRKHQTTWPHNKCGKDQDTDKKKHQIPKTQHRRGNY